MLKLYHCISSDMEEFYIIATSKRAIKKDHKLLCDEIEPCELPIGVMIEFLNSEKTEENKELINKIFAIVNAIKNTIKEG